MPTNPTVSVIITTSPDPNALDRALRSVFSQTESPTEILVAGASANAAVKLIVDGCSDRVRWIECPVDTLASQRNAAIRRSQGQLIALLDPTAVWLSTKLARSVAALTLAPQDDLVYTPAVFIDPEGPRNAPPAAELLPSGWILDEIFEEPWIVDSTVVFRREVWERHGGFDESLTVAAGRNFFLRSARAHRFAVIPEPLTEVHRGGPISLEEHARDIRETAEMLHRFYDAQGGDERLDSRRARRALGELCEVAARLSWAEQNVPQTLRASLGAMHYHPTWRSRFFLSWVLWQTRKVRAEMGRAAG